MYTTCTLTILLLGNISFILIKSTKIKLFKENLFSNTGKVMLWISDVQYFVPLKLFIIAGSIHLFKIKGKLFYTCKVWKKYTKIFICIRLVSGYNDFK